jgi:hypothetical protein
MTNENSNHMTKPEIILSIHGGVLQDVYASDPEIDIILVDWDVAGAAPDEAGLILALHNRQLLRAFVTRPYPFPLQELAGSEIETLIHAAAQEPSHATH